MLRRTRQPVARPDKQHIEPVAPGIVHHSVEFRASRFRSAETVVRVLAHDLEAIGGELPKLTQLGFWVLVKGRNTAVQRGAFHRVSSPLVGRLVWRSRSAATRQMVDSGASRFRFDQTSSSSSCPRLKSLRSRSRCASTPGMRSAAASRSAGLLDCIRLRCSAMSSRMVNRTPLAE